MTPAFATPPAGSRCATHPDAAATHVCARCGGFLCAGCAGRVVDGRCQACVQRTQGAGGAEGVAQVAAAQRWLIWALVASVASLPLGAFMAVAFPTLPGEVLMIVVFGVYAARAVATFRLASALSMAPLLWAIGALLPNLIGIIVLLVVNHRATTRLRDAGWTVGLLGGRPPRAG